METETEIFTAQKLKPHLDLEASVAYRGFETFLHEVKIFR